MGTPCNCTWLRYRSWRKPLPLCFRQKSLKASHEQKSTCVLPMWCHVERHLPMVLFWKYSSHFCFICCAINPPSWGLKHALILPTTARRVCYGQQQEACRNLWGVCVSAEKEPWSQFAVSFHYSRRNFLMESGSCSRQTLHKREMPGLALRLVWCIGNKEERNWELKVKKRAEIQGSPQELKVLGWQNGPPHFFLLFTPLFFLPLFLLSPSSPFCVCWHKFEKD